MFQQGNQGFVPDELNAPAGKLAIIAQNPGSDEELAGQPLVGATGRMMESKFLPVTGFRREEVNLLNVLKCRWQGGNKLPPAATLKPAMKHCMSAHFRLPAATELTLVMGGLAYQAMGGEGTITDWRGHVIKRPSEPAMLPTLHLADLFREPTMHHVTVADWRKVKPILRGEYPRHIPNCTVNDPGWFLKAMEAPYVVVDG